jgi:hypothetical protein
MEWYQRGRPQTRNEAKNKRLIRKPHIKIGTYFSIKLTEKAHFLIMSHLLQA